MFSTKRAILLSVLLVIFLSTGLSAETQPSRPSEEPAIPPCQWFWMRDVDSLSYAGWWFATDEEGNPDLTAPINCFKEPGAELVFPDLPAEVFNDPKNPPKMSEVLRFTYRSGNIGPFGIKLIPVGRWEWACG